MRSALDASATAFAFATGARSLGTVCDCQSLRIRTSCTPSFLTVSLFSMLAFLSSAFSRSSRARRSSTTPSGKRGVTSMARVSGGSTAAPLLLPRSSSRRCSMSDAISETRVCASKSCVFAQRVASTLRCHFSQNRNRVTTPPPRRKLLPKLTSGIEHAFVVLGGALEDALALGDDGHELAQKVVHRHVLAFGREPQPAPRVP